jgi:hypothetical protein
MRSPGLARGAAALIAVTFPAALMFSPPIAAGASSGHRQEKDPGVRVTTIRAAHPGFAPQAQAVEFQGLGPTEQYGGSFYSFTPGEPSVAVGPSDIVETVNEAAAVFDKSGHKVAEFDFGTFWGGTDADPTFCTDPRALYLASGQFAISCSDNTSGVKNPMRFAISKTSDPTGAWYLYAAPNTAFLDQDKIVATSDKFIIAGNTSSTEVMYVYNLADVESGVSNPKVITRTATMSNIYEAVVEQTLVSQAYFVSSFPGNSLYLATVTGTPSAGNVKLKETHISASDFPAPQNPQVPGGSYDGGDGRVLDAVYEVEGSDGKPVIQYSSTRLCGTRDCLTSARIDLSGTKPVLKDDTLVGEPGWDYTYGAVGLDATGNVFEAYSRSNVSTTPDSGVLGPGFDVTLQPSTPGSSLTCTSSPCFERWGDYLQTAIDPSDTTSVWVTGLYQSGNSGFAWGTVIAKVSTTTYALPAVVTGAASKVTGTSAALAATVNPNGVATTYHLDYGLNTGYDAATTETSAGSGTATLPVTASISGLLPGTTYHYRIVATTAAGSATGTDRTFKTSPAKITSVVFTGSSNSPTVTVKGKNFGAEPVGTPAGCGDSGFDFGSLLSFQELSQGWAAGGSGDCIGLIVSSYTPTQVVYGFGSNYSNYGPVTSGDQFTLTVQTAKFSGTVAYT